MKNYYILVLLLILSITTHAQVSNIEIRVGGDLWKLGYTVSSSQINCGLCPQIIGENPDIQSTIFNLQDSVTINRYRRSGLNLALSASIGIPALRGEIQIGPSMRRLNTENDQIGRYANRNISLFFGVNPMQFSTYFGKYYIGTDPTTAYFLDLSDAGIFAQFSYDGGFEEYVRSTNNMALLARWQPTLWLNDQKRVGVALRGGARLWLLGNLNPEGPFIAPNGLPKKVRPEADWFAGIALKITPF